MNLPIYQVDAFAQHLFKGNPAAIMPLQEWLPDDLLQSIAMENNLSETAFFVAEEGGYALRWFTPTVEVDLCGHATLAAAHVLFEHLEHPGNDLAFNTRSGRLLVSRSDSGLTLDFPATQMEITNVDLDICNALGATASEALSSLKASGPEPLLYVYDFAGDVAKLTPHFDALLAASQVSVIVTAPGEDCDFVSRFFGPQVGIDEDPVTGSAHCILVPYWAKRLQRQTLQAHQISQRGGRLACELREDRVFMTGSAVTFMQGNVTLP